MLLNYNKDTKLIDFRHYSVRLQPVGVSRRIRKFVQKHDVPDLSSLKDVSEFLTRYALFTWIKIIMWMSSNVYFISYLCFGIPLAVMFLNLCFSIEFLVLTRRKDKHEESCPLTILHSNSVI